VCAWCAGFSQSRRPLACQSVPAAIVMGPVFVKPRGFGTALLSKRSSTNPSSISSFHQAKLIKAAGYNVISLRSVLAACAPRGRPRFRLRAPVAKAGARLLSLQRKLRLSRCSPGDVCGSCRSCSRFCAQASSRFNKWTPQTIEKATQK